MPESPLTYRSIYHMVCGSSQGIHTLQHDLLQLAYDCLASRVLRGRPEHSPEGKSTRLRRNPADGGSGIKPPISGVFQFPF